MSAEFFQELNDYSHLSQATKAMMLINDIMIFTGSIFLLFTAVAILSKLFFSLNLGEGQTLMQNLPNHDIFIQKKQKGKQKILNLFFPSQNP